jgi:type VI secretion system protein ImpJ
MYLAPNHFQAQGRYFEDSMQFATATLWNNAYGFSVCELDSEALRNGTVAVREARGLFQDGLPFDIPTSDPAPEPRSIADVFPPTANEITICLSVPSWSPDGPNCELNGTVESSARYFSSLRELPDENTGRDEKPVRLGRKNVRLRLPSETRDDELSLPIARVVRDSSGRFAFDEAFIPPCLKFTAGDHLFNMLRRLVEILEEKSAAVSQDQRSADQKFQPGLSSRQVAQFWFLHAVNSSLTPLRHLLVSKQGHPEELFREMLRLGGALCTFGLDVHPRSLPTYDHANLDKCFHELDEHIRRHLEIVVPSQAISIPLHRAERYFYQGEVKDQRCFDRARWILGIRAPLGEADLILKTQQFVKFCSSKFVPELVKRALPGLTLTHMSIPPSSVAAKVDFQYFSISRSGPCWEHIMQTKNVGVYVPGELPSAELELIVLLES